MAWLIFGRDFASENVAPERMWVQGGGGGAYYRMVFCELNLGAYIRGGLIFGRWGLLKVNFTVHDTNLGDADGIFQRSPSYSGECG